MVSPNDKDNYQIKCVRRVAPATRLKKNVGFLRKIRVRKGIKKYLKFMVEYLDIERCNGDIF